MPTSVIGWADGPRCKQREPRRLQKSFCSHRLKAVSMTGSNETFRSLELRCCGVEGMVTASASSIAQMRCSGSRSPSFRGFFGRGSRLQGFRVSQCAPRHLCRLLLMASGTTGA